MRSRLEPLKKVARSLRSHRSLLPNWFHAKGGIFADAVEGFNNKTKLTMRKTYGFRTYRAMKVALYHTLGDLPEPPGSTNFVEEAKVETDYSSSVHWSFIFQKHWLCILSPFEVTNGQ